MLFSEYEQCVILTYRKEKSKGTLSLNLLEPTAATLRNECLIVLSNRPLKKDDKTLRLFFNFNKESNDYSDAIEKYDPDGLKPLVNFLKGKTARTEKKNIELLAWLIDFKERPYIFRDEPAPEVLLNDEPKISLTSEAINESAESTPTDLSKKGLLEGSKVVNRPINKLWKETRLPKKITGSIAILVFLIGGLYMSKEHWTVAYICEQGTGKKYHLSANCPTLKNCANGVVQTTITAAEKNGKTLCSFEHK